LPRAIRRLTRPAAARDYWDTTPLRRYLALTVLNAIFIERPGHGGGPRAAFESIEAAAEGMGTTHSLIIFPEGTRGEGDEIGPFMSGIYHLAKRMPGVELVPVFMENLNRILPKGEMFPIPMVSSISFGAPLVLGAGEKKPVFLDRARQAVIALREN
jgi:1-acyl-sn-glycerol-3-phosphate acyltransferase